MVSIQPWHLAVVAFVALVSIIAVMVVLSTTTRRGRDQARRDQD